MTLDLQQIAPQLTAMAHEAGHHRSLLARRSERARALLHEWDRRQEELALLVQGDQPRVVGEPLEPLLTALAAPLTPPNLTVLATDGSAIDLDRHGLAHCYLINIGAAVIRYGTTPQAALTAQATLYYRDEDLFLDGTTARVAVQGPLIDLKRTLAEQQRALEVARTLDTACPTVAMVDGTLLLWQLSGRAGEDDYVTEAIATYAAGLTQFQRLGIPVCSYISRPNGHEVVNLLRLASCPGGRAAACPRCRGAECVSELLEPLPDRSLMTHLAPGERSARFASRSPVLRYYGEGCGIQFFYLHAGSEIARCEVPTWVGDDPAMLDLVHAAVYDSCTRGWGYPPALAEAHEQAVIRGGEREAFMRMTMAALDSERLPAELSVKRLSKNRRAV